MRKTKLTCLLCLSFLGVTAAATISKANGINIGSFATECSHAHVEHHDAVNPTLITNGTSEYWCCCDCHVSFKDAALTQKIENTTGNPTDSTDGRFAAALGASFAGNPTRQGTVSSEAVPAGTAFDTVYEQSGLQGQFIFADSLDISGYEKVAFMMKAEVWFIAVDSSWTYCYGPNSWKTFELVQTATNVWSLYKADPGADLSLQKAGLTGSDIKSIFKPGGEASNYWVTNLRGIEKADSSVVVASSSVDYYTSVSETAPKGFKTVTLGDVTYADANQGKQFLSNIDMYKYESVKFAFKTANRRLCDSGWANALPIGEWFLFTAVRNADGTITGTVSTMDGVAKFSYANKASFKEALLYYNYDGDQANAEWYSTEVRGYERDVAAIPATGSIVNDCFLSANGIVTTETGLQIPRGYEKIRSYVTSAGSIHGMYYAADDIRGYSEVHFAIKTNGYFLFNGWGTYDDKFDWIFFSLTNNGDTTFNMTASRLDGTIITTVNNMESYKGENPVSYTNYSLNSILYGVPSTGYYASQRTGYTLTMFATEVRGTLA